MSKEVGFWSDFDGTAVAIASKADPRNWSKYPLRGLDGYVDLLEGVISTGVHFEGVVSRRPNILPRRLVTHRSISKIGMGHLIEDPKSVVLTGSETAKAQHVMVHSQERTIGLIDDKPHRIGVELLKILNKGTDEQPVRPVVVLGVVNQPGAKESAYKLEDFAHSLNRDYLSRADVNSFNEDNYIGWGGSFERTSVFENNSFRLDVVSLAPYSHEAGAEFGEYLLRVNGETS